MGFKQNYLPRLYAQFKKTGPEQFRQYMIIYVKKGVTYANIYVPIQKKPLPIFTPVPSVQGQKQAAK